MTCCLNFYVFRFSLHSNTALDVSIKGQMIRDLLNLAGFRIPHGEAQSVASSSPSSSTSR